jgi:hypothetical protein
MCARIEQYRPAPMDDYASFQDRRVKHLKMIQAVISRLGPIRFS